MWIAYIDVDVIVNCTIDITKAILYAKQVSKTALYGTGVANIPLVKVKEVTNIFLNTVLDPDSY